MDKIIVASSSSSKLKELQSLFKDYSLVSINDYNIKIEREEDGNSYQENALIKATEVYEKSHNHVLADDSGIEIEALNNQPGLYSSRYLSPLSFEERHKIILDKLKDCSNRKAVFKCALCFIAKDGSKYQVLGEVKGSIAYSPRGNNGFGYDPIFIPEGLDKTYAELTDEEKDTLSHRYIATKLLIDKLPIKLKRRLQND